jgi:hypothetical protein
MRYNEYTQHIIENRPLNTTAGDLVSGCETEGTCDISSIAERSSKLTSIVLLSNVASASHVSRGSEMLDISASSNERDIIW